MIKQYHNSINILQSELMSPLDPAQISMHFVQELKANRTSMRLLEKYAKQIVAQESTPQFESVSSYVNFLALLKERQPAFIDSTLYPKVLSLFRQSLGWPEELSEPNVRLVGKDGVHCTIPKELLEFRFQYFRTLFSSQFFESQTDNGIYTVKCSLSSETLKCFASYLDDKKITVTTRPVLDELIDWAELLSDETFQTDVAHTVFDYFTDEQHAQDFDQRYVEMLSLIHI